MVDLIRTLFRYQAWADIALLEAVKAHPQSVQDEQLLKNLNHIVTVQKLFLSRFLAGPFDLSKEFELPDSFDELVQKFRATHDEELVFVAGLTDSDLERRFDMPALASQPTIAEGLTHIILHGQNHRGQCLTRLRENGGMAPTLDYILWARGRGTE
jgi:uncharacterized damage-inducible protein DinB